MRMSQLASKTRKDAPKDEAAKNAQLLIRAGFIYKDAAGVYAMLPLGLRVLNKIIGIIREEMDGLGAQEVLMSSLQRRELWEQTNRWDDEQVDVWFKTKLKNGTEVGLGWSHEEQMTEMMREFVSSYRDLPRGVYQFQNKLRNETRAKSGIMRTREFIMKDMYSFSRDESEHEEFYKRAQAVYTRIFERLGLGEWTYLTFASGGAFAQFSHEFQTLTEAGEDTIYIDHKRKIAINQEVMTEEVLELVGVKRSELEEAKAAEVGNIFNLGTSKSEPLGLQFTDEDGVARSVVMGSYGIGPARVMGVIVERYADEKGLVWPEKVAPYSVHMVRLGNDEAVVKAADKLYDDLGASGVEVLYDDRDESAGAKFADADLIGVPVRLTVSKKTVAEGSVEWKARTAAEAHLVKLGEVTAKLK
ncbi:MAG TPA: aminoacyl--tRNA ligase-related protein [Candidatus Saccharimonadia bacterium]